MQYQAHRYYTVTEYHLGCVGTDVFQVIRTASRIGGHLPLRETVEEAEADLEALPKKRALETDEIREFQTPPDWANWENRK